MARWVADRDFYGGIDHRFFIFFCLVPALRSSFEKKCRIYEKSTSQILQTPTSENTRCQPIAKLQSRSTHARALRICIQLIYIYKYSRTTSVLPAFCWPGAIAIPSKTQQTGGGPQKRRSKKLLHIGSRRNPPIFFFFPSSDAGPRRRISALRMRIPLSATFVRHFVVECQKLSATI